MSREDLHPPLIAVRAVVASCLAEDLLPLGDLTASLLAPESRAEAAIVARAEGVLAGTRCLTEVYRQLDPDVVVSCLLDDGDELVAGAVVATLSGPLSSIVSGERSALNFVCHLSGVASLTRRYVRALAGANSHAQLWDTRKTTPGLRSLEKAAVRAGGAANHRGNLSEAVLVKDNHLGGLGITAAVAIAKSRWPARMIEVECDTLEQVKEALVSGATVVMCDNMTPEQVRAAVALAEGLGPSRPLIEASGGVNLANVADYGRAGADLISVGAITHSAPVLDLGLDLA